MSANTPPNPYFSGIDYNKNFFSSISNFITLTYANTHYLLSYGNATSSAITTQFSGSVGIGATASGTAGDLQISSGTVANNLYVNGKIGMGTTTLPTSSTLINAYSTTYTLPRITLTGTEFYSSGSFTSTDGIALILGVNRSGGRQLWVGDTALMTANATNPVIRLLPGIVGGTPTIDAFSTDASARLNLNLAGNITVFSGGNVGIGTTTTAPSVKLAVEGAVQCTTALTAIPATNTSCTIWNQSSVGGAIGGFRVAVYTGITTTMAQRVIVDENGSVGINTSAPSSYKLEINATGGAAGNAFRIYDYGNANSGYITMNAGGVSGTPQCGFISFYQPTTQARAGYIGWGQSIGGANYLLLETEGTYSGYNVNGNLLVNGTIGQGLANTDMNITTYGGNTTGGNMNISAVGAAGTINLSANGSIRFKVDPLGYNVAMSGTISTLQQSVAPIAYGIAGYWYIPIPYLNTANNFYHLTMLNIYNGNNSSFWTGHIIINPISNQLSYTTLSNGGFFDIQIALVLSSGWNIKIAFTNNFPITSAHLLYYKYIG